MKWTTQLKQAVINNREAGMTYDELAAKYNCSKSTISTVLKNSTKNSTKIPGQVQKKITKNPKHQVQKKITKNSETGQDASFVKVPIVEFLGILKLLRNKNYKNKTLDDYNRFLIAYLEGLL